MSYLPLPGGLYRHQKGGEYFFLLLGKDEATQIDVAIYRSKETQKVWVRPLDEFCEPRFVQVFEQAKPDAEWERFFNAAERKPRKETVIAKLDCGVKLAATYDDETESWHCATSESRDFSHGQLLKGVVAWRYQASK